MPKRDPFADPPSKTSGLIAENKWRKKHVVPALAALDAYPVENTVCNGMPDVVYIGGWLELKCIDTLPRKPEQAVKCAHFRPDQRAWLVKHDAKGGRAFVMVLFTQSWRTILLPGEWAAKNLGLVSMAELHANSLWDGPWSGRECFKQVYSWSRK